MADPTEAELEQFKGNVQHMVMLQDQLKTIAAQTREARSPVKEAFDNVQAQIINFMKQGHFDICNYQDEKIELHSVARSGSLTKKSLMNGLLTHFNGDEAAATACFDAVIASLGTRELDILKRVRKRKPAKGRRKGNGGNNVSSEDAAMAAAAAAALAPPSLLQQRADPRADVSTPPDLNDESDDE